ncbi:MAG: class I SAM-dependent methyltransferase [Acidimicrobiia bacterium]
MERTASQHDTVRSSFDRQVPLFTGATSVFAGGVPDVWGPLDPDAIALDVACGAGHVSEQIAPHVRQVVGIDLTPTLLELGTRRLADAGVRNVLLQEGDAADLPFTAGSFDLVVCRSSLHHFDDVEQSLREMRRVCRRGGRVAINELVQPPGADAPTRERYDAVHRLLDPSHMHALTDEELTELVTEAVGPIAHHATSESSPMRLDAILTDASDRDGVWAAFDAELDGGPPSGLDPSRADDAVQVVFRTATFHVEVTGV